VLHPVELKPRWPDPIACAEAMGLAFNRWFAQLTVPTGVIKPGGPHVPHEDENGHIDPDVTGAEAAGSLRSEYGVLGAIALGGAIGSLGRVEISRLVVTGEGFPWSTFIVNAVGSLLLGFLIVALIDRFASHRLLRPFLATGICGGFTTFSTFAVDINLHLRDGRVGTAILYALASVTVGIVAVVVGMTVGRSLRDRSDPQGSTDRSSL
jgi:fluoride exporter